ncbi:hypothetical protein ACFV7Q_23420 [Streptomyces sp. NPDC059851]|uniref:hypothetical protein n=1 Tax=Streptomyces sp. NPDC059851 TaxID=3346971 RepID=UPI00365B2341
MSTDERPFRNLAVAEPQPVTLGWVIRPPGATFLACRDVTVAAPGAVKRITADGSLEVLSWRAWPYPGTSVPHRGVDAV